MRTNSNLYDFFPRVSTIATVQAWKKTTACGTRSKSVTCGEESLATGAPQLGAASSEASTKSSFLRSSIQSKVGDLFKVSLHAGILVVSLK
jgi:hypothetical protein